MGFSRQEYWSGVDQRLHPALSPWLHSAPATTHFPGQQQALTRHGNAKHWLGRTFQSRADSFTFIRHRAGSQKKLWQIRPLRTVFTTSTALWVDNAIGQRRPPPGLSLPWWPGLGHGARLPGPLQRTAAFPAVKEATFKDLTFKYNQDLPLLEANFGFDTKQKGFNKLLWGLSSRRR